MPTHVLTEVTRSKGCQATWLTNEVQTEKQIKDEPESTVQCPEPHFPPCVEGVDVPAETQANKQTTAFQEESSGEIFHLLSFNIALVIGSIWKGYYPIFLKDITSATLYFRANPRGNYIFFRGHFKIFFSYK